MLDKEKIIKWQVISGSLKSDLFLSLKKKKIKRNPGSDE